MEKGSQISDPCFVNLLTMEQRGLSVKPIGISESGKQQVNFLTQFSEELYLHILYLRGVGVWNI